MKQHGWIIVLGMLMTCYVVWAGCNGGTPTPVMPEFPSGTDPRITDINVPPDTSDDQESRIVLAYYRLVINEEGECSINPVRQAEAHIDVTSYIFPPSCSDCFTGELVSLNGNDWTFNFTLKNPTNITGYDVRAILLDTGQISLITQPDSYTTAFAEESDTTPRNPYYIFDSLQGQNEWGPLTTGSREVSLTRPEGAGFYEIDIVIDASWPENQDEPVQVTQTALTNALIHNDGSDSTDLTCRVDDWQDNVDWVIADLSELGGSSASRLSNLGNGQYSRTGITCASAIEAGTKTIWITASSGSGEVHNYITVEVKQGTEPPPPPPPPPGDNAAWTVLVYLHATDLPDTYDINELEMSGSIDGELNLLVLWDKASGTDVVLKIENDPGGYNGTIISSPVDSGDLIPPGGLDMSSPDTLEDFLIWSMEEYPAEHYLLDLWDHGGGIFIGADQPEIYRNVCGGLSLWEIRDACENALAAQSIVDKFDIIGFDVCILGWIETAYCLKDVTDIVIASENNEPGGGWDYGPPFINLKSNIETYTSAELAADIVDYYLVSYTDPSHPYHYLASDCTQAAASTSALVDHVVPALNSFCSALIDNLYDYDFEIYYAREETNYWGLPVSDIGHFAQACIDDPDLPADIKSAATILVGAIEAAMISHGHNSGVPAGESGWKIWWPEDITSASAAHYQQYLEPGYLEFSDTLWDDFLFSYVEETPPSFGCLEVIDTEFDDTIGGNGNGVIEQGETIDVTLTVRNNGDVTATNIAVSMAVHPDYLDQFSILDATQGIMDIIAGGTGLNASPFRFVIDGMASSGQIATAIVDLECDQSNTTNVPVTFTIDPADFLVLDLDVNATSAPVIITTLQGLGYDVDSSDGPSIAATPLDSYEAVFIVLGMYDLYFYVQTQADYDALEDYMSGGGLVYLESGEAWYWNVHFEGGSDIGPLFGLTSDDDGAADEVQNLNGEVGTFLDGLSFTYSGDDFFPDWLEVSGGTLVMSNDVPNFGMMVSYDSGTYRSVASSLEFGGFDDGTAPNTKAELMGRIISFLYGM